MCLNTYFHLEYGLKGKKDQFRKYLKRIKVGDLQYQLLKHHNNTVIIESVVLLQVERT